MQIIVAQNKKLIKYCNTLRGYYVKSIKAIKKYEQLQQENTDLKHENKELKKKNHKLNKYISNIFEVVSKIFKISKERIIEEIKKHIKEV